MSDTANCPTCGATCRIVNRDRDGAPQLQAVQDTDAQNKIEQLKQSLSQLRETFKIELANTKAKTSEMEQLENSLASANAKISNLEAQLSNLRSNLARSTIEFDLEA